mgnify:CR=1 FL=1
MTRDKGKVLFLKNAKKLKTKRDNIKHRADEMEIEIVTKIKNVLARRKSGGNMPLEVFNLKTKRKIAVCGVTAKKAYKQQIENSSEKTFSIDDMKRMSQIYKDKSCVGESKPSADPTVPITIDDDHSQWINNNLLSTNTDALNEYYDWVKGKLEKYDNMKSYEDKMGLANSLMQFKYQNATNDRLSKIDRLSQHPEFLMNLTNNSLQSQLSDDFILTENQQFLKKFLSPNTANAGILLFHGVGRGKTCSALNISANFIDYFENPTLIIASEGLQENFKRELFDRTKVKDGKFEGCTDVISKGLRKKQLADTEYISKTIKMNYDFTTQQKLVNSMKVQLDNIKSVIKDSQIADRAFSRYLEETFSDRVIIMDEVQHIRSASGDNELQENKKEILKFLEEIFRVAKNVRLVLLSATPMFDDATEILDIMKILMLTDKTFDESKKPMFKEGKLTKYGKEKMKFFASNYVSYLPGGEDPDNFPLRLKPSLIPELRVRVLSDEDHPSRNIKGDVIDDENKIKHTELYLSEYSKQHSDILNSAANDREINEIKIAQMANINWNISDVFDKQVIKGRMKLSLKKDSNRNFSDETLQEFAPKIQTILKRIEKAKGIVLVYSRYLDNGVLPICVALEATLGFTNFNGNLLADNKSTKSQKYIILTGNEQISGDLKKREELIQKAKEEKNKDGDIIKVIVINDAVAEGYDFKNIREVHILEPWHNMSKLEQIIGRAIRYRSHIQLDQSERNTTIYLHCGVHKDRKIETIDYKTYRNAEKKSISIAEVEQVIMTNSIDCGVNQTVLKSIGDYPSRNVLTASGEIIKNFKPKPPGPCDFDSCHDVKCSRKLPPPIDLSSTKANVLLLQYQIKRLGNKILKFLKQEKVLYANVDEIYKNIEEDEKLIDIALDFLDKEKVIFKLNDIEGHFNFVPGSYVNFVPSKHPTGYTFQETMSISKEIFQDKPREEVVNSIEIIDIEDVAVDYKRTTFDYDKEFNALKKQLEYYALFKKLDENIIGEMVLDRISQDELHVFMKDYLKQQSGKKDNKQLHKLLLGMGYLIVAANKHIFFDHYDGKFKELSEDKSKLDEVDTMFKKDQKLIEKLEALYNNKQLDTISAKRQDSKGTGTSQLYIITKEGNNKRECKSLIKEDLLKVFTNIIEQHKDTLAIVEDYQKIIEKVSDNVKAIKKITLCDSIEYCLRFLKEEFISPVNQYINSQKDK